MIKLPDAVSNGLPNLSNTPGAAALNSVTLSDPPELTINSQRHQAREHGALPTRHVAQWGLEAAGNYESLYAQAGYYGFDVERAPIAYKVFSSASSSATHVVTSEQQQPQRLVRAGELDPHRRAEALQCRRPAPSRRRRSAALQFRRDAGWGAFELAGRFSDLNLNSHALDTSNVITAWTGPANRTYTFFDTERGGDQRILTAELNWYPNNFVKFGFAYQYVQVSRLQSPATVTTTGTPALPTLNGGQNFSTFAIRSQFAL